MTELTDGYMHKTSWCNHDWEKQEETKMITDIDKRVWIMDNLKYNFCGRTKTSKIRFA